jgi:hypothetical protein
LLDDALQVRQLVVANDEDEDALRGALAAGVELVERPQLLDVRRWMRLEVLGDGAVGRRCQRLARQRTAPLVTQIWLDLCEAEQRCESVVSVFHGWIPGSEASDLVDSTSD